ncbi:MAG: hypothetical protein M3033_01235 [Acidobacteriota bacterium]|nr:hypothetical protein [Acidobacteriota bacterium]
MAAYILTTSSVILCPHGGVVTHIPRTVSDYVINGALPMLLTDQYLVAGCPFAIGDNPSPCFNVTWVSPSVYLIIKGVPALLNTSIGLCQSIGGMMQGQAIIASYQIFVMEPREITVK